MVRIGLILIALIGISAASLHVLAPAAAAAGCPACYGFAAQGNGIYVERGASPEQLHGVGTTLEAARARVARFYGSLAGSPRILACVTDACYRPLGGGSRGLAILDRALILSSGGTDEVIAAHELAHIELHTRIGLDGTLTRAVPQWFDEGLAVLVSDDPRYLRPDTAGDRCLAEPGETMPASRSAWIETAQSAGLYAQAACRVSRWVAGHGGPPAAARLAAAIAGGASFADASR